MTRMRASLEFVAGAAIGVLVGLIAGLSISPITSTLLGALSTTLLILLGFKESKDGEKTSQHAFRVLGFGMFCSIFLLVGIALRTYQVLSPALKHQKESLMKVGIFTPAEIDQILLLTNFGMESLPQRPADIDNRTISAQRKADEVSLGDLSRETNGNVKDSSQRDAGLATAGLLRAGSPEFCQIARREKFKNLRAYLGEVRRIDRRLARVIENAPVSYQDVLSKSLSAYICP